MSDVTQLAKYVADVLNDADILPCEAEYKAYFKQDVESLKNDVYVLVCPHSESWNLDSRSTYSSDITIDVAIQHKLVNENPDETAANLGEIADSVAGFLFGKSMGPYVWKKTEYYPYHGESLEQIRTFVSIVSTTYSGRIKFVPRVNL